VCVCVFVCLCVCVCVCVRRGGGGQRKRERVCVQKHGERERNVKDASKQSCLHLPSLQPPPEPSSPPESKLSKAALAFSSSHITSSMRLQRAFCVMRAFLATCSKSLAILARLILCDAVNTFMLDHPKNNCKVHSMSGCRLRTYPFLFHFCLVPAVHSYPSTKSLLQ
jgi:hypothetical protein